MTAAAATLDLIDELRLRRWARENYVSAELRDADWEAVVLDEMFRRDLELADATPDAGAWIVPLAPEPYQADAPHAVRSPHILSFARTPGRELHYT